MSHATKQRRYLRKRAVADRYGTTTRNIELKVRDGTLPPPEYFGRFPIWDEELLDEHDRRRALTRTGAKQRTAERDQRAITAT